MPHKKILFLSIITLLFHLKSNAQSLFIGQDEAAIYDYFHIEKNDDCLTYRSFPLPVGFTQYIDIFKLNGLKSSIDNGAGSNCVKNILDDVCLKRYGKNVPFDMAIGISMNNEVELTKLVDGVYDSKINELADFLKTYPKVKFYLRIGYEFDGQWNKAYNDRRRYIVAFQRIHDLLRVNYEKNKTPKNWVSIWQACTSPIDDIMENKIENLGDWYPGDKYVDFCGLSWFLSGTKISPKYTNSTNINYKRSQRSLANEMIYFANSKNKPAMICEAAPQGYNLSGLYRKNISPFWDGTSGENLVKLTPLQIWNEWYKPFFEFIEKNKQTIKVVAYINQNWDAQPMWALPKSEVYWGDSRIQANDKISQWWTEMISNTWK
ncbi:Beta-1,3-xylanase XYL4 [Emticicia aquatica]|uniref:Beta-1,3-xylanase XYL4 n=1 Tax=Emticicia aquatica TaxID=1681835 RepID=A0ABM9AU85_9BACT|nr:hypothetical protein [Emticicia aquatica]CAH0997601.1 Beta-1,3-xylanase XYL4 [Emticicia aquatica]